MSDLLLAAAARRRSISTELADAIDFDGVNDYLSRNFPSGFGASSTTVTMSFWVYRTPGTGYVFSLRGTNIGGNVTRLEVFTSDTAFVLVGYQDPISGAAVVTLTAPPLPVLTWTHVLVSFDLSNSSRRHCFINGNVEPGVSWSPYLGHPILFGQGFEAFVGNQYDSGGRYKGRLAHVYLDHTYRDLSIEANRRLFITEDRKPAKGQADLNPILYLPLDDPEDPGYNAGTGGHFTLNGVVARSGRGPSQFNAPYSDLDGSADYLSRSTALTGLIDGSAFTFSCAFSYDNFSGGNPRLIANYSGYFQVYLGGSAANGTIEIVALNSSGSTILSASATASLVAGRNYTLTISVDLSSTSRRHICLNGTVLATTWSTYTNGTIRFDRSANGPLGIGYQPSGTNSSYLNGRLGNVFFDTKYIDLSDPKNLAKFVTGTGSDAKPVDLGANGEKPFGTPPLIYLPMYGNNAGKNYGTGGDFTVNSGPFPGARGPNEYWGNWAKVDLNIGSGSLTRASGLNIEDSKTVSIVFSMVWVDVSSSDPYLISIKNGSVECFEVSFSSAGHIYIRGNSVGGGAALSANSPSSIGIAAQQTYFLCIDLTNTSKRKLYRLSAVGALTEVSLNWIAYNPNNSIGFSAPSPAIFTRFNGSGFDSNRFNGRLSEFYLTTDYIDFSQEANRLKFRDAFGNPVDLRPQIEAGELPEPAIYMRFDPANFGKNEGYGGDFTVNGTITDGGQL